MNTYEIMHRKYDSLLFEICRMVCLLDDYYDVQHRAYMMKEKEMVIINNHSSWYFQICV